MQLITGLITFLFSATFIVCIALFVWDTFTATKEQKRELESMKKGSREKGKMTSASKDDAMTEDGAQEMKWSNTIHEDALMEATKRK